MSLITLLALPLACGTPLAAATPTPAPALTLALESFDELQREFDDAYAAWKLAYADADKESRKRLRDEDPIELFWARFVAAGDAGEGRALLWQLDNLRKAGLRRAERDARAVELLEQLVERHRESKWFGDVGDELGRRARKDPSMLALLERVATATENADNRAQAMVAFGGILLESDDAEAHARGEAMLKQVQETFADTEWANEAYVRLMAENLKPGKLAPDFVAKTIEEHEFKLSDYRGKVVLLDFYGFW